MQNMHARPACAKQGAAQQSVRRTDRRQHLAVDGCLADQNVGRYAKTWEVGNNPSAKSATGEKSQGYTHTVEDALLRPVEQVPAISNVGRAICPCHALLVLGQVRPFNGPMHCRREFLELEVKPGAGNF